MFITSFGRNSLDVVVVVVVVVVFFLSFFLLNTSGKERIRNYTTYQWVKTRNTESKSRFTQIPR